MQDMQDMLRRLNQSGKRLSKGHRKIAEYIVEHYDKAVFMTASKLGEKVGVSESTVVRFASAMGYEGYPQLQRALQELEREGMVYTQRTSGRFVTEDTKVIEPPLPMRFTRYSSVMYLLEVKSQLKVVR